MEASQMPQHGPYPPTSASSGGVPTITTDIPICAVFLFFYVCFAITNQTLYQLNRRRGHHFFISLALFGFCMARILTFTLRIGWATKQHNIRLAIASQIFVNAGILIVYVVNFVLAQRILRAKQPRLFNSLVLDIIHKMLYIAIVAALALVITAVVWSLYTLDRQYRSICRDIQLAAITFLLIFTTIPLWYLAACFILPKSQSEKGFGQGSLLAKMVIVATSTSLSVLIAGFKAGITWSPPRPATSPAWYDSKACYYIFNPMLEVLILSTLVFSRIDKRFFTVARSGQQQHDGEHVEQCALDAKNWSKNEAQMNKNLLESSNVYN